jgi:hypothetical protein
MIFKSSNPNYFTYKLTLQSEIIVNKEFNAFSQICLIK